MTFDLEVQMQNQKTGYLLTFKTCRQIATETVPNDRESNGPTDVYAFDHSCILDLALRLEDQISQMWSSACQFSNVSNASQVSNQ